MSSSSPLVAKFVRISVIGGRVELRSAERMGRIDQLALGQMLVADHQQAMLVVELAEML